MNWRTHERDQNPEGIEGSLAPVRVTAEPDQRGRGQNVQPAELARHAHPGLVGVVDGNRFERPTDGGHRWREQRTGFLVDRQYRGVRYLQAEQVVRQRRCRNVFGELAPVYLAAGATRFENLASGGFVAQERDV
ncbi:MAG: hypothetical protein Q8P42_12180 [Gallionella sp.]|nr:hypothetical protein [Gallionella sp.]